MVIKEYFGLIHFLYFSTNDFGSVTFILVDSNTGLCMYASRADIDLLDFHGCIPARHI
jgi:hypothetical protein